jgi:hypothetical protein
MLWLGLGIGHILAGILVSHENPAAPGLPALFTFWRNVPLYVNPALAPRDEIELSSTRYPIVNSGWQRPKPVGHMASTESSSGINSAEPIKRT